ncbi:MAG: oligosaccharide flippase family protein [Candidatus Acidiferrales bacterium]
MGTQRSFANALKWAYAGNWGERAFSALFAIILAAILGPRDFGTVSIALIYIGFLQMFLDQGFMAALIQKQDLEPEHVDSVFWMDLALSLVLVAISILLSGWWAAKNHAPQIGVIISALSVCIPIEALAAVQATILKKEMDFRSLTIRSNVSILISGAVGIGMAIRGFGVWSLVGQQIVRDSTSLVILWKMSPWRPSVRFSGRHLRDLTGFSSSNFLAQLGIFADQQAGSIALGFFFGPVAVGLYRVADRIANSIIVMATSSVQAVALPEFSRLQDRPVELRKSALTCVHLSSVVSLPALAGLAAVSGPLMAVIGPQWIPAAGVLKILSVLGMFLIFVFFTGPLLQALSKTRDLAFLEWARTAVGVTLLVIAGFCVRNRSIDWQVAGIAFARFCTGALLVTPVFVYILMRLTKISLRDLIGSIASSVIASASIVVSVMLISTSGLLSNHRPVVVLITEVVAGAVVGTAVLSRLDFDLRQLVITSLRRSFARHRVEATAVTSTHSVERVCEESPMKVSIVIPTYNRAYIIGDALESALGQTYRDVEIIVVDDGSTDHTREIIERYGSEKIRYIRHEDNRGCSAAYNTGISAASGSFISILDSDDLWMSDYVERQMSFFQRHPEADVVFTNVEIVSGSTRMRLMDFMPCFRALLRQSRKAEEFVFTGREIYLCLLEEIPIKPSAAVIRREMLNRVGGFDEAWPSGTDWDLFIRLSKLGCFGYIDRVMAIQRRTADATHQRFREQDKLFLLNTFMKEKTKLAKDREALRHINRGICGLYNSLGWTYLETGRGKAALSTYYQGFKETWHLKMLRKLAAAVVRLAGAI